MSRPDPLADFGDLLSVDLDHAIEADDRPADYFDSSRYDDEPEAPESCACPCGCNATVDFEFDRCPYCREACGPFLEYFE